jgi:hypothetical protein
MNCKESENTIHELASRRITDKTRQFEALEHAGRCLWCAMRLDEESRLTDSLNAFAATLRGRRAPARVEEALLQAFRDRNAQAAPAGFWLTARAFWKGLAWSVALAAVLSLTYLVILHWPHGATPRSAPIAQTGNGRRPASPEAPPAKRQFRTPPLAAVAPSRGSSAAPRAVAPTVSISEIVALAGTPLPQAEGQQQEQSFIPLATCDDSQCLDEVTLVRVTLPAEARLAFGVGSDSDNDYAAEEPVQADVALGSDGVPFAIRFVE